MRKLFLKIFIFSVFQICLFKLNERRHQCLGNKSSAILSEVTFLHLLLSLPQLQLSPWVHPQRGLWQVFRNKLAALAIPSASIRSLSFIKLSPANRAQRLYVIHRNRFFFRIFPISEKYYSTLRLTVI